jgi:hypothetical protein
VFFEKTITVSSTDTMINCWPLIAFSLLIASCQVMSNIVASSFTLQVLKSCRTGQCIAGSNNLVTVSVTTGQFGSTPCAPQQPFGLCPGSPLFEIGSYLNYSLTLLDLKSNAPINYTFSVPMKCKDGVISGILNTPISGYYRVTAIAFYNGLNPPQPGSIENLDCTNQPKEDDPMIVRIMPGSYAITHFCLRNAHIILLQPNS